jgi:(S)-citramalyl-CoA lyase
MPDQSDRPLRIRRSFIFAPALRPELYPKALACGSDIVCVELEDGVAPDHKDVARNNMLDIFSQPQVDDGIERIVRVNSLRSGFGLADIQAILDTDSPPPALMLPKVNTPDEVKWLDDLLTENQLPTRIHIIIETNAGLEAVFDIARSSPRIDALFFGGVDMSAELRCANTWDALLYARSRVVHAAASAEIDAIDVPHMDLDDAEGLEADARRARELGFCGKGAIHPKQIAAINQVFTPDPEIVDRARSVVRAFEESDSALVVIDGKLIEKPVLREMKRILMIADSI